MYLCVFGRDTNTKPDLDVLFLLITASIHMRSYFSNGSPGRSRSVRRMPPEFVIYGWEGGRGKLRMGVCVGGRGGRLLRALLRLIPNFEREWNEWKFN